MKNKIIIGIVAVILIGVGVWYFALRGTGVGNPVANVIGNVTGTNITNADTLAALLVAGRTVKCTVAPTAENNDISGTFYVANKKMRGDYSTGAGAQAMSGHMIMEGQTSYTWMDGQTTGFKMVAPPENANANVPAAESQGFDQNQKMDYHCEAWTADSSVFTLPAGVRFSEFNPSVTQTPSSAADNSAQCATCDKVPEAYRAQCKTSLGCK